MSFVENGSTKEQLSRQTSASVRNVDELLGFFRDEPWRLRHSSTSLWRTTTLEALFRATLKQLTIDYYPFSIVHSCTRQ